MWHRGGIRAMQLDCDHHGVSIHTGEKETPQTHPWSTPKLKDHEEEKELQRRRKAASKVKLKSAEYRKSPGIYLKTLRTSKCV